MLKLYANIRENEENGMNDDFFRVCMLNDDYCCDVDGSEHKGRRRTE